MGNKYWNSQGNLDQPKPSKVSRPNLSGVGVITPSGAGPNLPGTGVFSRPGPGAKAPMAVIKGK